MKDKVLFITGIIGSFSATILIILTNVLTAYGVDTTGYADILNLVSIGLAAIILIVATIFLNRYNVLQQKVTTAQNTAVTTALEGNATIMQTILPDIATQIMTAAEERSQRLMQAAEDKVNSMMNEMLPALATQTMQVVTEKSQNIVEETTAKANATMQRMDELIPTYAKRISDAVAQTVRENNAHYHKMLTDIKALIPSLSDNSPMPNLPTGQDIETIVTKHFEAMQDSLLARIDELLLPKPIVIGHDPLPTAEPELADPLPTAEPEESEAQNDETEEKSDETDSL